MLANRTFYHVIVPSTAPINSPSFKVGIIYQFIQVTQPIPTNVLEHLVCDIGPPLT
jgi:hypothetical protein